MATIELPLALTLGGLALTELSTALTKFQMATLELSLALTNGGLALIELSMATIELLLAGSELPLAATNRPRYLLNKYISTCVKSHAHFASPFARYFLKEAVHFFATNKLAKFPPHLNVLSEQAVFQTAFCYPSANN